MLRRKRPRLQERAAELQSRLDREQADAKAAAAALQSVRTHVGSLEQTRDALQRRVAAAEEQAQRLQKAFADGMVNNLCLSFHCRPCQHLTIEATGDAPHLHLQLKDLGTWRARAVYQSQVHCGILAPYGMVAVTAGVILDDEILHAYHNSVLSCRRHLRLLSRTGTPGRREQHWQPARSALRACRSSALHIAPS